MQFLAEVNDTVSTVIEEGTEGKKSYYIQGPFMQAEIANRNKRIYPKKILENQVSIYMEKVKNRSALGELNHPSSPNVNPERASHIITELNWDGNNVIGKAKILEADDFPCARIARGMIKEGIKFGVSTRGMGSVKQNRSGLNEVQADYKLVCVDLVSDPSGPDCWVNGIMESAEWTFDPLNEKWVLLAKQEIDENVRAGTLTLEQKVTLFKKYLKQQLS